MASSSLTAAVSPLLESISLGRTDIMRKLLEEVKGTIEKSSDLKDDEERAAAFSDFLNGAVNDRGNLLFNAALSASPQGKDAVRCLLRMGADASVTNGAGQTVIEAVADTQEMKQVFVESLVQAVAMSE